MIEFIIILFVLIGVCTYIAFEHNLIEDTEEKIEMRTEDWD